MSLRTCRYTRQTSETISLSIYYVIWAFSVRFVASETADNNTSLSLPLTHTRTRARFCSNGYMRNYETLLTNDAARPIKAICQTPILTISTDQTDHICSVTGKMMLQWKSPCFWFGNEVAIGDPVTIDIVGIPATCRWVKCWWFNVMSS
jgi:hypothetical protein